MFPARELKSLAVRKLELLDQSAVQRQLLAHEAAQLEQGLAWLDRGVGIARRVLPLCSIAIPLLGLWRARGAVRTGSVLARLANALPIARRLAKLWQHLHDQRA